MQKKRTTRQSGKPAGAPPPSANESDVSGMERTKRVSQPQLRANVSSEERDRINSLAPLLGTKTAQNLIIEALNKHLVDISGDPNQSEVVKMLANFQLKFSDSKSKDMTDD